MVLTQHKDTAAAATLYKSIVTSPQVAVTIRALPLYVCALVQ